MATLPTIKRLLTEDFPEQASWIGLLFYPLNQLLNTVYANLANGLTFAQNMLAQVTTQSVSGASPTVSFPYKFSPQIPIGMLVLSTVQTSSGAALALAGSVGCTFTVNSGVLTATVQGLNSGATYNVTFVVLGG